MDTASSPDRRVALPAPAPTRRPVRRAMVVVLVVAALLLAVAAPAGALLTGIDVASYQHPNGAPINWSQVRSAGHSFAFVKATEGTTYTNPWYRRDFDGAGAAGLYRGAYHYARPALPLSTATAQARYMVSVTGTLGGGADLPLVLDLEETGGLGPSDLAAWARTFLGELERLTGRAPIIYVGYYFWRDSVGAPADLASRYRLWLPSYPADPNSTTFRPLIPAGFATWAFWQYTSSGSVPGIVGDVDLNRFCCDGSTLAGLAGSGGAAGNPFGNFEGVNRLPGGQAEVRGWAIDPDTTGPIDVHFYADGRYVGAMAAGADRPDVGAAYPGFGSRHGITGRVDVPVGSRQLCAYAINVRSGTSNPLLGCRLIESDPIGNVDGAAGASGGIVQVDGWALDPDSVAPIDVHIYVDGRWGMSVRTTLVRDDVRAAFAGSGPTQGFRARFEGIPSGQRTVCAYAINVGSGSTNPLLGCRSVGVPVAEPLGGLDEAQARPEGVRVRGWATDFDTTDPVDVHVYVDGAYDRALTADLDRPDIGTFFRMSPSRGFDVTVPTSGGRRTVCVFGINVGPGASNSLLGCRTVDVVGDPFGNLESVTRQGETAVLSGWVIDPDTTAPVDVHVYVDSGWGGLVSAGSPRPDVGAVFPRSGPNHGFSLLVPVGPTPRQVCAFAINVGAGRANTPLGCRRV